MAKEIEEKEKTTFEQFREGLPTGFSRIVEERLAKRGIQVTRRLVQYVANGKSRNAEIEKELIDLFENPPPKVKKEKKKSDFELKIEELLTKEKQ